MKKKVIFLLVTLSMLMTLAVPSFAINGDQTKPVIVSAWMDQNGATLHPGDKVMVEVVATDENGINAFMDGRYDVSVGFLNSDNDKGIEDRNSVWGCWKSTTKEDTYYTEVTIDDSWLNGKYILNSVSAMDNNSNLGSRSFSSMYFFVEDSIEDQEKPVVESITSDKMEAKPGEVITFTVKVSDASGIAKNSDLTIDTMTAGSHTRTFCDLEPTLDSSTYVARYWVDHYTKNTELRLAGYSISDTVGNRTIVDKTYSPLMEISVSDSLEDYDLPNISYLKMSQLQYTTNDIVSFEMNASNDLDLTKTKVTFKCGDEEIDATLTKKDAARRFEGVLDVKKDGVYNLSSLTLVNQQGEITFENPGISFEATGKADVEAPNVKEFVLDKTVTKIGETITFTMKAEDTSGIDLNNTEVVFSNGTRQYTAAFQKTSEADVYEAKITLTNSFKTGTYTVDSLTVADTVGNKTEMKIDNCNFTVYNALTPESFLTFIANTIDIVGRIVDRFGGGRRAVDILKLISDITKTVAGA